jgi:hypothetical protein
MDGCRNQCCWVPVDEAAFESVAERRAWVVCAASCYKGAQTHERNSPVFDGVVRRHSLTMGMGLWPEQGGCPAELDRTDSEDGMQVLTRGPVHEAFAETVTFDPEPGIVVIKDAAGVDRGAAARPAAGRGECRLDSRLLGLGRGAERLPLDQRHCGAPCRRAASGCPAIGDGPARGFQWTSGYWADAQASEIEYLPEPPATVEVGPNIARPSADESWIPGSWVWYQGRYAWRPGYWMTVQPDWDWVPAHYVWAPRGYVFVDGYWDYSVSRRGVLFAPVYFKSNVYARPGFAYSPATVINLSVFSDHLFVRPRYNHYYFGDYYAPSYRNTGFYASFSFHSGRRGYDPIYTQQRWRHRQDPEWGRRVEANFSYRRDHENARPLHTLAAQVRYLQSDARRGEPKLRARELRRTVFPRYGQSRAIPACERRRATTRSRSVERHAALPEGTATRGGRRLSRENFEPIGTDPREGPPVTDRGRGPPTNSAGMTPRRARPTLPPPDPKVERRSEEDTWRSGTAHETARTPLVCLGCEWRV